MVDFGNYVLSDKNQIKKREVLQNKVTDSDLQNFKLKK